MGSHPEPGKLGQKGENTLLHPSNSSGRVSCIPHTLISATPASQKRLFVADCSAVFAFELWCTLSCSRISFGL